jgi:predicted nucleic acid-binding protein
MITYLLDSNTIADFLARQDNTLAQIRDTLAAGNTLGLCRPVYYEVLRGLLWRDALGKRRQFDSSIGLFFTFIELADADWDRAATFYASARRSGRQIADTDLLLAAIAFRLDATIVSSDNDFDALPVKRVSWRIS